METHPGRPRYYYSPHIHPARRRSNRQPRLVPEHSPRLRWGRRTRVQWRIQAFPYSSSQTSSSTGASSCSEDEACPRLLTHLYSCYSDTETAMPGGFENSALKSSFSLSSLQPSSVNLESPEHATFKDRPYNSLRKKCRKDIEGDMCQRSWGSREESKEAFWADLKNDYQYLMNINLIESCKEAGNDLQGVCGGLGSPMHDWSFDQFKHQFVELDSWLNSIQEEYMKGDVTDRNLRLNHMEEMLRKSYKRKVFHNQGGRLVARSPKLKEEVAWRVLYLNNKWEKLEQTVTPRKRSHTDRIDVCFDIEKELRCFRRWVKQTDKRLASIDFQTKWSSQELVEKTKEHEVLQRDVESHGKIVRNLVRVCERINWADSQVEGAVVTSFVRGRRLEASQAVRFARSLERRWQLLYLRSLEWLCHIEGVKNRLHNSSPQSGKLQESDGEPASKHPRLSDQQTSTWLQQTQHPDDINREDVSLMDYCLDDDIVVGSPMDVDQQQQRIDILEPLRAPVKCSSGDNINVKMKTDTVIRPRRQSIPMDVSRKLFQDDSSKFTQSERLGPHCAVMYYRHKDTDSEQDVGNVSDKMGKRSMEDSSDEEWTYTNGAENTDQDMCNNGSSSESRSATHTVESYKQKPVVNHQETEAFRTSNKEDIQRLINQAEELVREDVTSSPRKIPSRLFADSLRFNDTVTKGKISRVKEWLSVQEQDLDDKAIIDSCDASCECTTEDDDLERHSSDDLNTSSVATCHHSAEAIGSGDLDTTLVPDQSFPSPALPNMSEHTKVIMRQKRKDGPQIRPWSVSEMPQLGASQSSRLSNFSISESALHQLAQNASPSNKMESSVHGTLSSSTVEETTIQAQEGSGGGYSSNSLRRRKVKLRKRNLGRKSESGSDGVLAVEPGSPMKNGQPRQPISGTETEEETEEGSKSRLGRRKLLSIPAFRLGPNLGAVTVFKTEKVVSADSSFSEQAWDNYQEKYMSEAYSEEAADPEAARRLLEFGDDYRNFLDSQSDCASSFGRPLYHHRHPTIDSYAMDSDSDIEDVCKLINQSHSQYVFIEQVLTRLSKVSPQLILATDFADIIARCRENIHCLRVFLENIPKANDNLLSPQEFQDIRILIDRWESLEGRSENLQRMRTLQREMSTFRDQLLELSSRVDALKQDLNDQDQLELRIQQIKVELAGLRERKAQLLQVNVAVHRFLTDTGHPAGISLKEDVNDLYRIWDETHQRASQQLSSLQQLSAAWQQFELHLSELQVALRGDHETLRMLDSALQGGSVSPDVATSVRDVAKVLSEKQEMQCESAMVLSDSTSVLLMTQGVSTTEGSGSLSDSGISDSGSEQELSEREKRLAALRRLARHLEAILAPGSQAITDMAKRIELTELELRGLQQTCRELIVRTAVCAEAKVARKISPSDIPPLCTVPSASRQRSLSSSSRRKKSNLRKDFLGIGDPDDPDPGKPHSWLWRVMRAALPFQMAIMALVCVAFLLEPHCCDSINNLNFSLSPQLRYLDGPPPV